MYVSGTKCGSCHVCRYLGSSVKAAACTKDAVFDLVLAQISVGLRKKGRTDPVDRKGGGVGNTKSTLLIIKALERASLEKLVAGALPLILRYCGRASTMRTSAPVHPRVEFLPFYVLFPRRRRVPLLPRSCPLLSWIHRARSSLWTTSSHNHHRRAPPCHVRATIPSPSAPQPKRPQAQAPTSPGTSLERPTITFLGRRVLVRALHDTSSHLHPIRLRG